VGPYRALLLALVTSACLATRPPDMPRLANAVVSTDFESYTLRRIGLPAFVGRELTAQQGRDLQHALHTELAQSTPYEIVLLDERDLAELEASDPYRRGWYEPRTIIGLAKRYSLDGILFGTVSQQRFYPPQLLSLQVDMVSAETGLVIWSGAVDLDGADQRVIDGLAVYYSNDSDRESWRVALLSPERFARFAAFQVACLL
jgi:hypothetical protein